MAQPPEGQGRRRVRRAQVAVDAGTTTGESFRPRGDVAATTDPAGSAPAPARAAVEFTVPNRITIFAPIDRASTAALAAVEAALSAPAFLPPLDSGTSTVRSSPPLDDATSSQARQLMDVSDVVLPDSPLPPAELAALTERRGGRPFTLLRAVLRSLEGNRNLKVEELRPEITETGIENAESAFDTRLDASITESDRRSSNLSARFDGQSDADRINGTRNSRGLSAAATLSGRFPTGTDYSLGLSANRSSSTGSEPFFGSGVNLNLTQNLLRGAGAEVNLVRVRTARNDYVRSLYGLQAVLETQVTDVQSDYFDLYLAFETLRIRRKAYDVARQNRNQVEEFVRVERSVPLDVLAAKAEEALSINNVITAAAQLKTREIQYLRRLNPDRFREGWRAVIIPVEPPTAPTEPLDVEERVRIARFWRSDLRQAEVDLANGELEVFRSRNGLLPALDLVSEAGLNGVGDTLGESNDRVGQADLPSYRVGLQFGYSLQNRAAKSAARRASFQRDQAMESLRNFRDLIEVEVRTAAIEVERTGRLIASTRVARRLREASLAAEQARFAVGRSVSLQVAQAQRDLVNAQLDEATARVAHVKAYLTLYRSEGTALQRRGIASAITPATGPVVLP